MYYPADEPGVAYLLRERPGHWVRVELPEPITPEQAESVRRALTRDSKWDGVPSLTTGPIPTGQARPVKQEFGPPPKMPEVVAWIGQGTRAIPVYADSNLGQAVVKQCDHEDMSCPPGECDDLYPPNREDSGR